MNLHVAMLSVHTCPLAALGGKETGGMNVYVREVSRELGRMGVSVDVFTRSQNPTIPRVVELGERARVIHLPAGDEAPMPRVRVHGHLDEFVDGVDAWRIARSIDYDLIHAHYWLSGVAALRLKARWTVPVMQMFHTLGRLKNRVARSVAEQEPAIRLHEETRIVGACDRIVAANVVERAELLRDYGASASRIATIPCGVDTDLFVPGDRAEARARLGLDERPVLLWVGRVAPIKGLDTLLDAVARLRATGRAVKLLIVGGDSDEPMSGHEVSLRRRIERLDLAECVCFVGPQPQKRRHGVPRSRRRRRSAGRAHRRPRRRSRSALAGRSRGRALGGPAPLGLRGRGGLPGVRVARVAGGRAPGRGALPGLTRRPAPLPSVSIEVLHCVRGGHPPRG